MDVDAIADLDLTGLSQALGEGRLTSRAITQAFLDRIARHNGQIGAFWQVFTADALREADASDARRAAGKALGVLDGAPIAIKDNIDVAGAATTAGIGAFRSRRPGADAQVIQRLRSAGMVILGKTSLDEAAFGGTGANTAFGDCGNPHRLDHATGGSSAGSAAAVAARLAPAALGSDTLGSVRLPASFCGVVGFKPAYGDIDIGGVVPLSPSLDHLGVITRTVRDADLVWRIATGRSGRAWPPSPAQGLHIGVLNLPKDVEAGVADGVQCAARALEGLGAQIRPLTLPDYDFAQMRKDAVRVMQVEAAATLGPLLASFGDDYSDGLRGHLNAGAARAPEATAAAKARYEAARGIAAAAFAKTPILLTTTTLREAFPIAGGGHADEGDATALANLAGLPAVSIPAGQGPTGLPLGVQLIAAAGDEDRLLAVAAALEGVLPPQLRPGLGARHSMPI